MKSCPMRGVVIVVLLAMALAGGPRNAGAGDDMWTTLKSVGKTPAQLETERRAEAAKAGAERPPEPATNPSDFIHPDLARITECYAPIETKRMELIADALERKLRTSRELPREQESALRADLDAVREAARARTPDVPARVYEWLTSEEQLQIVQEQTAAAQKVLAKCKEELEPLQRTSSDH